MFIKLFDKFFLLFSFVFPKAGTKLNGIIPLYISTIMAILYFPFLLIQVLKRFKKPMEIGYILILISLLMSILVNIIRGDFSFTAIDFSFIVSIFFLIYYFFVDYSKINIFLILNIIKYGVIFLIIYSILQKVFGEYNVVLPGLTADYYDASIPDFLAKKDNMIWGLNYLKLVGTYQNGNLFGANFILLFWFFFYQLKSKITKNISLIFYILISFATASTTIIMGCIVSLILLLVINRDRISFQQLIIFFMFFIISVILFLYIYYSYELIFNLINDRFLERDYSSGGGRIVPLFNYLYYLYHNQDILSIFFGSIFLDTKGGAYEMLFPAIFFKFGLFGLITVIIFLILVYKRIKLRVYSIGLYSYLFYSLSDGAFWLPPTSINYAILLGLAAYLSKNEFLMKKYINYKNNSSTKNILCY